MPRSASQLSSAGATVQGFWSGPPLSNIHWACLKSFLSLGHQFNLYSYETLSVPAGVRLEDATKIVPQEELFYFENTITDRRDIAPFADYFRLKLLYENGGWYCDVDTVCLSPELPVGPRIWANQCPELKNDSVGNSQLFFQREDQLLQIMLEKCRDNIPRLLRRESLGPMMLTSTLQEFDLPKDMSASAQTFYPIRWVEVFKLWLPEFLGEVEERVKFATFLQIYQSFPLYVGFDPCKHPPKGSYLSKLLDRFVPESAAMGYEADDIRRLTSRWLRSNDWAIEWLESIKGHDGWRVML
jgi:hypothetical protein